MKRKEFSYIVIVEMSRYNYVDIYIDVSVEQFRDYCLSHN